jgi:FixJ family two-component response regulator
MQIALLDDDRGVRQALTLLLKIAGHELNGYASVDEFLRHCDLDRVTGLILDQHMPRMTGLELASRLRMDGRQFPILLITGTHSPAIIRQATELGIEYVLVKPFIEAGVMAFIHRLAG